MGCGCGDLIESIKCASGANRFLMKWEGCGCGNLMEINCRRMPDFDCCGIDINPDNIEAATEKDIFCLRLGDSEDIENLLPPTMIFDIIIFCGLLNRQVTTRAKAEQILANALHRLRSGGHIIIAGYTSCHFTAADFSGMGMTVLRKSIPENIFKDYQSYSLRQLYVARKM